MFKTKRRIDKLIIHCAATKPDMDIGVEQIDVWHKERGWSGIGYHHVIRRDGRIENGRSVDEVGAHVSGHNTGSFGICMVGGVDNKNKPASNFTDAQWKTLRKCVMIFKAEHPNATVHGHNEFADKACPSFDVQKWLRSEGL